MKMSNRIVLFNDGNLSEDVNSAAKDVQTIYIQAASGTLSVNAPSAWVSVSDESVSGTPPKASAGQTPHWTTKKPTYQTNYPVTFVAEQRRGVNNQVTCSTPLKDDSQTIIDGGHITTGTIDANNVNVTNINGENIRAGTLLLVGDPNANNVATTSEGIAVRNGTDELAKFSADGMQVGKEESKHIFVDADGVSINNGEAQLASFKVGTGTSAGANRLLYKEVAVDGSVDITALNDAHTGTTFTVTVRRYNNDNDTSSYVDLTVSFTKGTARSEASLIRYDGEIGFTNLWSHKIRIEEVSYTILKTDTVQVILGRPDMQYSYYAPLLIGQAGAEPTFRVFWDGSVYHDGDLSNKSLVNVTDFNVSTGTLVSASISKWGRVVYLTATVRNANSVASGDNVFIATLADYNLFPKHQATGASYYGNHAIGVMLSTAGKIIVRNASSSAVSFGENSSLTFSLTYLLEM